MSDQGHGHRPTLRQQSTTNSNLSAESSSFNSSLDTVVMATGPPPKQLRAHSLSSTASTATTSSSSSSPISATTTSSYSGSSTLTSSTASSSTSDISSSYSTTPSSSSTSPSSSASLSSSNIPLSTSKRKRRRRETVPLPEGTESIHHAPSLSSLPSPSPPPIPSSVHTVEVTTHVEASGEEVDGLLTVSCGAAASSLVRKMPEDAKQETTAEEETGKLCDCCCWQTTVPEPVVLVACGSFNPITTMHLRMMELARDAIEKTWALHQPESASTPRLNPRRQVVVAGLFSPVSDRYAKPGLAAAESRCRLARLACATTSDWLAVDSFEAAQSDWLRTRCVLNRIQLRLSRITQNLNMELEVGGRTDLSETEDPRFGEIYGSRDEDKDVYGGSATNAWLATHLRAVAESARETTGASTVASRCCCGRKRRSRMFDASIASALQEPLPVARVKLVCGADLLQSFAVPDLWSEDDMASLARDFGIICISRPESNAARLLYELDILSRYEENVILVTEWCQNGLSATLVRRALARGQSVRYLVPDAALEEIYARGLYGAARPPPHRRLFSKTSAFSTSAIAEEELPQEHPTGPSSPRSVWIPETVVPVTEYTESGTDPLHVETRSHSVQTRLSSLPSPHSRSSTSTACTTPTVRETTPADYAAQTMILRRVILDPLSTEIREGDAGGGGGGLTAILPLLKQCTRCGSQRVRLLLVEKPPPHANASPLRPPSSPTSPASPPMVVHTPRHHGVCVRRRMPGDDEARRVGSTLETTTMGPRRLATDAVRHRHQIGGQNAHHHHHHHSQDVRRHRGEPTSALESGPRLSPPGVVTFSEQVSAEPPCVHHTYPHRHRHYHHHHQQQQSLRSHPTPPWAEFSAIRGRSLPRDTSTTPCQPPPTQHHPRRHGNSSRRHTQPLTTGQQTSVMPNILHSPEQPVSRRPQAAAPSWARLGAGRRDSRGPTPLEPRREGDGSAAPPMPGTGVGSLRRRRQPVPPNVHRHHPLTPPAMEAQPAPPRKVKTHQRPSPGIIPKPPTSLSQPTLPQRGAPCRTYDEVDVLLYNLCLNIESAL